MTNNPKARSFDDIAQAAGWSEAAQIDILLDYIGNQGDDSMAALAEYAEHCLTEEAEHRVVVGESDSWEITSRAFPAREKGDDDGLEYADPRDEREDRDR